MKIKLPVVLKNEIDTENKKHIIEYGDKEFEMDMSLASQMRWEAKFSNLANVEDLITYTERICKVESSSTSIIISKLKVLYCYLDTEMKFIDFLKMFDLANLKYTERLANTIKEAFEIIFESASEKN